MNSLKYGSLFTGLGVFDLAAKQQGFEVLYGCDNDPYCKAHFEIHNPNVPFFDDVTQIESLPYVDLMTFGFPCQDASNASPYKYQKPLNEKRTGLFWNAINLVQASRPEWVVAENVTRLRNKGLADCLKSFTTCGYNVGYAIMPASVFGALHDRERLFIIANASSVGREKIFRVLKGALEEAERLNLESESASVFCNEMEQEAEYLDA
jgi:DNA (cytosine-5)-methyltransferase 1